MADPKHGDERDHRIETSYGPTRELIDPRNGKVVYAGPLSSVSQSVSEKWCSTCQRWIRVAGIMDAIVFDVDHGDDGDHGASDGAEERVIP